MLLTYLFSCYGGAFVPVVAFAFYKTRFAACLQALSGQPTHIRIYGICHMNTHTLMFRMLAANFLDCLSKLPQQLTTCNKCNNKQFFN